MEEARTPVTILPPRLKSLQDYMSLVTSESQQWKDLHLARKNRLVRSLVNFSIRIDYYDRELHL
jgi:hypothetical protein